MSGELDLTKLSDAQLGALKMVGGDLTKLPDAMLMSLKESQSPKAEAGMVDKALDKVNTGVNWAGTQLTKGVNTLLGLPADVQSLGNAGTKMALESMLGPGKATQPMTNAMPGSADLNKSVFQGLGVPEVNAADNPALTLNKPFGLDAKVNLGSMLDAGAQAIPSMLSGGLTTAIPGFVGGVGSDAAGQAAAGTPYEIPARIAGGVAGYKIGQRVVTPLPANLSPEEARLVQIAKDKDIPLTVGQETGRGRAVESALSRFPTSQGRMASFADEQATAVNRDALAQAGAVGDRLDPTTMNRVIKDASREFDSVKNASGNVNLGPDFFKDLNKTITDYLDNTPAAAQVPSVSKRAADFVNQPGRTLTGEQYQEFRRTLNEAAQSVTDVGASRALQGMRNALDDAMASSLPADQAQAWKDVRKNWANLKILTKAAAGGTVGSRNEGNLSPSALSMALRQRQGVDRFASTEGGLNDTARVASYLADTIPNSGTPQTMMTQGMVMGGPVGAGFLAGGVPGALAGAGVAATPNVMARAMTGSQGFGWLRDYLANQAASDQLGLRGVPFALLPGVSNTPRLENRR